MASDGRRAPMPCGHMGTAVFGDFYVCGVKGCDGKVGLRCPKCSSASVRPFEAPPLVPPGSVHCVACGHVWMAAVNVTHA